MSVKDFTSYCTCYADGHVGRAKVETCPMHNGSLGSGETKMEDLDRCRPVPAPAKAHALRQKARSLKTRGE